jgi:hypothetical protein
MQHQPGMKTGRAPISLRGSPEEVVMGRRHADALPAIRHHSRSGNARVRIAGTERWLGPWGSAESRLRYDELIAAWIASGRKSVEAARPVTRPAPAVVEVELPTSADVTVGELARAWIASIERERGGNYKRASDWNGAIAAARALRSVAAMPARDFGPRALQDVRRRLVDTPFLRKRRQPDGSETFDSIPRSRRYVSLMGLEFEARLKDDAIGRRVLDAAKAGLGVSIGYRQAKQWHVERDGVGTVRVIDDCVLDHVAILLPSDGMEPSYPAARCYSGVGRWMACPVQLHEHARAFAYEVLKQQAGCRA